MTTGTIRVLVIDDFQPFRQWARAKLEAQQHFEITEAAEAGEGIQIALDLIPDVIVIDVALPDINGIEAARQLVQVVPSAKILFLSRHEDEDIAQSALSAGAKGYVVKCDAERELLPAMKEVLRGGMFISSAVKPLRCSIASPVRYDDVTADRSLLSQFCAICSAGVECDT